MNPSLIKHMKSLDKRDSIKNKLREMVDLCKMRFKDRKHLEEHLGKQLIIEGTYAYKSTTILGKDEVSGCVTDITCFYEDETFQIDHFLTTNKEVLLFKPGTKFKAYSKAFKYKDKDKYGLFIEDIIEIIEE